MRAIFGVAILLAVNIGVLGCNTQAVHEAATSVQTVTSPLIGKWSGKSDMKDKGVGTFVNAISGGPLTGPASLTLSADGTGFFKFGKKPERPISWKQEGGKIIIEEREVDHDSADKADRKTWVGTVSDDKHTLIVDMDQVTVTLNKLA